MKVALLAISDGRHEYHHRSLQSAIENLPKFHEYVFVRDEDHRLGFGGAIQRGWDILRTSTCDFVFHLELDFQFWGSVPVDHMVEILRQYPMLAQVCMKRQAVNAEEKAAGGIVERHPDWYTERTDPRGFKFTEHTVCFSTNPCVYPMKIARREWPKAKNSEGVFTHQLLADGYRFAFLDGKFDEPVVTHIGEARAGNGY